MSLRVIFAVVLLGSSILSCGQTLLNSEDVPRVRKVFDTSPHQNSLNCNFRHDDPELDFSFRWMVAYRADCSPTQFVPGDKPIAYLRLQPRDAPAIYWVDYGEWVTPLSWRPTVSGPANFNGTSVIVVGEGEYSADFLLTSNTGRTFRKQWGFKTRFKQHPQIAGLPPNSAAALNPDKWNEKLSPTGPRLTILLHATALTESARELPILKGPRLTYPEQLFWSDSVFTLLNQVPHKSADVVAFSVDGLKEISRQRNIDQEGFRRLCETLSKHAPGRTVASGALQTQSLSEFLHTLAEGEAAETDKGQIVIFVGPTAWLSRDKKLEVAQKEFKDASLRLFYLQYFDPFLYKHDVMDSLLPTDRDASQFALPAGFPRDGVWKGDKTPDSIDYWIRGLGGNVLKIHSAEEFRQAVAIVVERINTIMR